MMDDNVGFGPGPEVPVANVSRPLCAVCFRNPREEGTARCADCGPGRLESNKRPRPTRLDRATELLGGDVAQSTRRKEVNPSE